MKKFTKLLGRKLSCNFVRFESRNNREGQETGSYPGKEDLDEKERK